MGLFLRSPWFLFIFYADMGRCSWVFSSELPPKSINGHSVFDPAKSKTFKPLDDLSFSITYGDQSSASGIVGQDTVNIGGAKVENQAVELATRVSGSFTRDSNADGLLGLGFGVNNQGTGAASSRATITLKTE